MKKKLAMLTSLGGVVGTSLAATLGSTCCLGPMAVALLGVNGAIFAVELQAYRSLFLTASVTFLALGFWLSRRPVEDCAEGSCEARSRGPVRWLLWGATAVAAAAFLLPLVLG